MIFNNKFLKNSVIIFLSTSLVNVANLLYQILVVRKLSVANYGAFNSLLSVFTVISLPVASLAAMIAKFVSSYNNTGQRKKADSFLSAVFGHMFLTGLLFLAVYLLFGFNFRNYLHLDSVIPVYFVGGMLFLTILSTVMFGGLQGLESYLWLSVSNVLSGGLKLILALLFIYLGWDLLGALGAYVTAQIAGLSVSLFALREIFYSRHEISDIALKEKYKFIIPSFITLGCIALLTNIDVVFVKHFFDPVEAGYYSVAQLIGKIVLFVPGAIYIVMLPSASGLHAQKKSARDLLIKSLKYTAFLCVLVTAAYNLFPGIFLNILTGKVNEHIILLGRLFSVSMTFFSLLAVLLLYQLSISKFMFLKNLALFTVLQICAILFYHASLVQILVILILNSIVLCVLNFRSAIKIR